MYIRTYPRIDWKPGHCCDAVFISTDAELTDAENLIQEWLQLLRIVHCNLQCRRIEKLDGYTWEVTRLQLRWLHGE
jgi:hypothetical protein